MIAMTRTAHQTPRLSGKVIGRAALLLLLVVCSCANCEDRGGNPFEFAEDGGSSSNVGTPIDQGLMPDAAADTAVVCTADGICNCSELAGDRCDDLPRCFPVSATRVTVDGCQEPEVVGCDPSELCDNNVYHVEDPDGQCWIFGSGCFPSSFDRSEAAEKRCEAQALVCE